MRSFDWQIWASPRPPPVLAHSVAAFQQHPLYGAACAALGGSVREYVWSDGRTCLGTALILIRRWPGLGNVAMLARGPVWAADCPVATQESALHRLLDLLRVEHAAVIATPDPIGGEDPLHRTGWLALIEGGSVARLPLPRDAPRLRAGLHGKWRNRLVRAEGAGLTIKLSAYTPTNGAWLLQKEALQARARGYKRLPAAFTEAWCAAGGRNAALLAQAERDGKALAGMLFLRHGATASYHIGWTSAEGRACNAHRLLLYRAALRLAQMEHRSLDLGTLDTVTTPGLARFKLGVGAHPVRLSATRIKAPGSTLVARLAGDGPRNTRAALHSAET